MNDWHIITSEYPPDVGGVSDYTRQVAGALAETGRDVHVWCPHVSQPGHSSRVHLHAELGGCHVTDLRRLSARLDTFSPPRRLLVQWVPHGYGYHSMNVPFCLWLALRALRGDQVQLMVHEPFNELKRGPLRHLVIALVHRLMTMVLMRSVSHVWVAIPAWERLLRPFMLGRRVSIGWLPIPACLAPPRISTESIREKYASPAEPLVGHFGSYGQDISALLEDRLPAVMDNRLRPALLLIGARSAAFRAALIARHPAWSSRVHATGYLSPTDLTPHLQACDVFLQPYPDGITSRRTSAMACLRLGLPTVTTSGHLTEPLWEERRAVALSDVADPCGFSAAALHLLENREARQQLGQQGRRLYREQFSIDRVIDALVSHDRAPVNLPSCA